MHRRVVVALAAMSLVASAVVTQAEARPVPTAPFRDGLPMAEMGKLVGDSFDVAPPPPGLTPEQRAAWLLNEKVTVGRTPAAWLDLARHGFSLDATATPTATLAPNLVDEVLHTFSLVGLTPPATERATLEAQAATLSPLVRTEMARLVGTVNAAYAAQIPVAQRVNQTLEAGFDPHTPLLSEVDRDATLVRQQSIVSAVARFKAVAVPTIPDLSNTTSAPLFSDSEGLIVLGNTTSDTYTRSGSFPDPVLMVDPAGNDTYLNSAGGACPVTPSLLGGKWLQCNGLVVSVVADLGGTNGPSDDRYLYNGEPAAVQGAGGPGGLGILIDAAGNDTYDATMTRGAINAFEPVLYYFDGGAQGYGYGGDGLLLDVSGNDYYRFAVNSTGGRSIWALAQGFGAAGGVGIASDLTGTDQWVGVGLGLTGGTGGFEGMYNMGVGFYAGVGVITDTGLGNDKYTSTVSAPTTDYYALGFGAFGGLGMQADDGGNDAYIATETASNPWINPLLNCAFGTGSYAGVGIFLEGGGDDTYFGATTSRYAATIDDWGAGHPGVAYGLFVDSGGKDRYEMKTVSTTGGSTSRNGMGYWEPTFGGNLLDGPAGENTFGTFVDLGGANDTYIGSPGPVGNNKQWIFGVDR